MSNLAVQPLPWSGRALAALALLILAAPAPLRAADPPPRTEVTIGRVQGDIVLDGHVDDAGWRGQTPITVWFETRVGDNVEPQVKNTAYLAYDDKYFYAAFVFEDPEPHAIRAPLGDHDAVPSSTDYAGVIVDSRNDGKTAQMFLSNPRGVQYDALTNDASGEDNAPDYFWESMGQITESGWTLELKIPFSSLRYDHKAEPIWRILLYRNYPRDRRYQFFSARLPRDVNCFICNSSTLTGLSALPRGSHLVVAPFATAQQTSAPVAGLGSPLESGDLDSEAGLDVKWSPTAGLALDGTINPDFSQVESDAAQIVANERFALFFPEKRPFFLEGVDLFATPVQAVYTRTVTEPSGGVRATGKRGSAAFTMLATRDEGGGLVVIPGPQGSAFAEQDFRSDVGVLRVRRDLGLSSVSVLATGRDIDGGGHNWVVGPDFQWRPRSSDSFAGQVLWSDSKTPNRPDLASEWDGRELSDYAAQVSWSHTATTHDWYVQGQDFGKDFRADNGFVPQVGYREAYGEIGYTFRPKDAFLSRARLFTANWIDVEPDGDVLFRRLSVGSGMDGRWNSFIRIELNQDEILVGTEQLDRFRPRILVEAAPSRFFNQLSVDTYVGEEIDFANARKGTGVSINGSATLRPGNHLELRANVSRRWLDVDAPGGGTGRLFTAEVERLRATWSFSSRSFIRLIGQYVQTQRDPSLYTFPVTAKDATFSSSALFAYKLNWQTVFYLGYGGDLTYLETSEELEKNARQAFAKLSYAWQP